MIISTRKPFADFRYVAMFFNKGDSKAFAVDNRGQILHFLPVPDTVLLRASK